MQLTKPATHQFLSTC